ncbi:HAD family hydrolase [Chlorobaculum sp. 24CR]|uniref:HAD family hydrolase n=1 Tax=Chlorobaculum sp. 24CR TaxID=2508878 RepID=UPI00100BD933|nr:HAD hydrolase-like protein [Chlorobaculum sp. 24CR]RXK87569.1 HAD family hydrolase [Chlorobaculum sp. 24CR]
MYRKLVLFDIDGTLLRVSAMNRRVLADALLEVYGTEGSTGTHDFSGKMDSAIIYDVLSNGGLTRDEIAGKFDRAKAAYIDLFRERARREDITLFEGVRELLDALASRSDILLGLLTGNFEASGRHKLKLPGIDHYFPFGAFADDAHDRNELPRIAHERARRIAEKNFSPSEIVIIGDTEHDIRCARELDARSIAVATGNFSMQELSRHQPGALFRNFAETGEVLAEILTPQLS